MKKLVLILLILIATTATAQQTFFRKTAHRPVKKLSTKEVQKIQTGHNMYYRENGKVYRTSRFYSGIKRPKDATRRK